MKHPSPHVPVQREIGESAVEPAEGVDLQNRGRTSALKVRQLQDVRLRQERERINGEQVVWSIDGETASQKKGSD